MLIVLIKAKYNREKHNVNFWFAKSMCNKDKSEDMYMLVSSLPIP